MRVRPLLFPAAVAIATAILVFALIRERAAHHFGPPVVVAITLAQPADVPPLVPLFPTNDTPQYCLKAPGKNGLVYYLTSTGKITTTRPYGC